MTKGLVVVRIGTRREQKARQLRIAVLSSRPIESRKPAVLRWRGERGRRPSIANELVGIGTGVHEELSTGEQAIAELQKAKSNVPLELEGDPNETVVEAAAPEENAARIEALDKQIGITPCLILTVSENGFGKRTDTDAYRLQSRGGKGVINMRTTPKIGKVSSIQLVDETTELMVISQFVKIIRIDTKSIRAAGRATMGVKLRDLDDADKVTAAVTIPPEEKNEEEKPLVQ